MSTVSSGGPSLPSYHALNSQIKNEHYQHQHQQQQHSSHHHHLPPPPPPPPLHASSSAAYMPTSKHGHGDGGDPHASPHSAHSSPYVSPRLQPSHSAELPHAMSMPPAMGNAGPPGMPGAAGVFEPSPVAAPMRRGAVSGASGPLSFPPLPPLRHPSIGGSDSRAPPGPYPPYAAHGYGRPGDASVGPRDHDLNGGAIYSTPPPPPPHLAPNSSSPYHSSGNLYHPSGLPPHRDGSAPGSSYSSWLNSPQPGAGASRPSYSHPHHQPPSILGPSSAGQGPSFPLSSSYSLSAGSHPSPQAPQPSQLGSQQRRGGLSASSGIGVYGAAAAPAPPGHAGAGPYWGPGGATMGHGGPLPVGVPVATGGGFKRKQTSANPPPRNYGCPACPASFSRRHDLNRHSRIHLAVKPFGCPNCQKTFSRKDALKRHLMVKGCGKDAEGKPRKRRGRKSNAEKASEAAALRSANGGDGLGIRNDGDGSMGMDEDTGDYEGEDDEESDDEDGAEGEGEEGEEGASGGDSRSPEGPEARRGAFAHPGQGGMMSFGDMGAA